MQPNAIGTQGWNLYGYAAGNPTTLLDPSGKTVSIGYAVLVGAAPGFLIGAAFGYFACQGSSNVVACVLREGVIGAIAGAIAGLLAVWAFAALAAGATTGWGVAAAFVTAEFLAAAADSIVSMLLRGAFDPKQALIDGLIGAVTAGVLNGAAASDLIRRLDDLFGDLVNRACSFSGETRVVLADGSTRPIADLQVGDWVLAFEPETGRSGAREVTATWEHLDVVVELRVGEASLTTTLDHPFWNTTDGEWQAAAELDRGDALLGPDGVSVRVEGIVDGSDRADAAFNLTVDGLHTSYVMAGDQPVLVHNTCNVWKGDPYPNSKGDLYPNLNDPRTGEPIHQPPPGLERVPVEDRVPWGATERGEFIKDWYDRGYDTPPGGWSEYDIHHITPREYGGTNDFDNLVPVPRTDHQQQFNPWWSGY